MYEDAFTQYRIDVDHSILDKILELRNQDHRYKNGRGWQSYPETSQPYPWFDPTFQQVSLALGQTPLTWWFNVHRRGDATSWHNHPNFRRVAVLYLQTDSTTSAIEFREGGGYWQERPNTGDLLVFPGQLDHRVLKNNSDTVRISVAFNFEIIR